MAQPENAEFLITGAGIHGLSTAWKLVERPIERGDEIEGRNVITEKTVIAGSNHGWKMLGVGHLIADEVLGQRQEHPEPIRFARFGTGERHPVSRSQYPWS